MPVAIADVLGSKVGMSQEKYKTLQCLNIPELNSFITTDMCSSLVHLLPMMQINFKVSLQRDVFLGWTRKGNTAIINWNPLLPAFNTEEFSDSGVIVNLALEDLLSGI